MHSYLTTTPFDLYELHLFHLLLEHGSFTKAAEAAGLTQSAITRQIQGMERSLGVNLFERTTRVVRPTAAGKFLFGESRRLVGNVDQLFRTMREEFAGARKEIRVGVSRSIGVAYMPGFFHANLRCAPDVGVRVAYESSQSILSRLDSFDLEIGVLCPPARLPKTMQVTHSFRDAFTLIAVDKIARTFKAAGNTVAAHRSWMQGQSWLLIEEGTNTGQQLRGWISEQELDIEPAMQLDSFDLIISLVALGMGASFVPIRSLAVWGQKRPVARVPLPERFERELTVVIRKQAKTPEHVRRFVENILF